MRDQNSKREAQRFRPLSAVGGIYNTTGELRKAGASSPSSLLSFAAWRSLEGGGGVHWMDRSLPRLCPQMLAGVARQRLRGSEAPRFPKDLHVIQYTCWPLFRHPGFCTGPKDRAVSGTEAGPAKASAVAGVLGDDFWELNMPSAHFDPACVVWWWGWVWSLVP